MPHALACRDAKIILNQRETVQEPQQEPAWRTNSYAGVVQGTRPIPKPRKRTLPTGNSKPAQQPQTTRTNRQEETQPTQDRITSISKRSSALQRSDKQGDD
ncbi:hypothetical protein ACOMHN_057626 [Nucella lapillus]